MADVRIERNITIAAIVSTEYLTAIKAIYKTSYLEIDVSRLIVSWCFDYYEEYSEAPGKEIEQIYLDKLKEKRISKDLAEELEDDILPDLNDQFEREGMFNLNYYLDQTLKYFQERSLELHTEEIQDLVDRGELTEADKLAKEYTFQKETIQQGIYLDSDETLEKLKAAFTDVAEPIVKYPGALGTMLNRQLVRGGFVAFLGSEKRGKSFLLLDIALRALRNKANVVFFQAGDMTENQQLKRVSIYLTKRPEDPKYSGIVYRPVRDCILNQIDDCDRSMRECDFGPFEDEDVNDIKKGLTFDKIKDGMKEYPDYKPCRNCKLCSNGFGSVWYEETDTGEPLTWQESQIAFKKFFRKFKNRFKLSTHPNDTLTMEEIKSLLVAWEKSDGFVPDLIIIDYADLIAHNNADNRSGVDSVWKGIRSMGQLKHCLMITATQADAKSYTKDRLDLTNFSEDKRKYSHVTAMYGLNQDRRGREKELGVLAMNELVVREGDFSVTNEVKILQNLAMGRAYLGSFR
jgi:hypothetical protein